MPSKFLTTAQAAEWLAVTSDKIVDLIHSGQLVGIDVSLRGGQKARWRISREALDAFLLRRQSSPASPRQRRRSREPTAVTEYY